MYTVPMQWHVWHVWFGKEEKRFWLDGFLVLCLGCGVDPRPRSHNSLADASLGIPTALKDMRLALFALVGLVPLTSKHRHK